VRSFEWRTPEDAVADGFKARGRNFTVETAQNYESLSS
jgi:hypothetical protein